MADGTGTEAALAAVDGFMATCYPGWSEADVAAERGGQEFLDARASVRRALSGEGDAAQALALAAPIVRDSFPARDVSDAELDETMGEDNAAALRGVRDALVAALGVPSLHDIPERGGAAPGR